MPKFPWLLLAVCPLIAQPPGAPTPTPAPATAGPPAAGANQPLDVDRVLKQVDDLMWHLTLGDIAEVDKVEYTSLPPAHLANPRVVGANNPLIIRAYTFIPKNLDRSRQQPLIVFAHQGIHANSDTRDAHIFRELLQQGYSIVSSDYRGSTGYGRGFYEQIDYGGRGGDGVYLGKQGMLETYAFLEPQRGGIVGWSHGGAIALMNIFQHPQSYAAAYAGVPASDLVRGRLRRGTGERSGSAHGLPIGGVPLALLRAVSHREDRSRGYRGVSQALAGQPREGVADSPVDPYQHQRRGCQRAGSGAPD